LPDVRQAPTRAAIPAAALTQDWVPLSRRALAVV
jgi:hypothetical protein